ncbi:MAG: hypothetical protein QM756_13930 [Polyangiaceae bacterium]
MRTALGFLVATWLLSSSATSRAADGNAERTVSPEEVEAWLAKPSGAPTTDMLTPAPDEAPPAPPRKHGITLETAIGTLSHLGPLAHVSPISPWFHLQLGYEPFRWLMVFAEGDLVFSNTSYAAQPPPSRTYRLYGFGPGLRLSVPFGERFGAYAEGSAGLSRISDDLLGIYGYPNATTLSLYFGGRVGLEWFAPNPRLSVALSGGARMYPQGLKRERSSEPPLALLGNIGIRYTF